MKETNFKICQISKSILFIFYGFNKFTLSLCVLTFLAFSMALINLNTLSACQPLLEFSLASVNLLIFGDH